MFDPQYCIALISEDMDTTTDRILKSFREVADALQVHMQITR